MIKRYNPLFIFASILLVSLFFLSCAKEPEQESLGTILDKEIPRLMEAADVPGLSIAVVRDGQIFWEKAGWNLHTYTAAQMRPGLEIINYLLFEKGV